MSEFDRQPTNQSHVKIRPINGRLFSVVVPAVIGYGASLLCVSVVQRYGLVLFMGVPLLVSFAAAFCYSFRVRRSYIAAYGIAVLSILLLGAIIMVTAMDGLMCLLMALPLALVIAVLGAALGYYVGQAAKGGPSAAATPLVLVLLFPFLVAFEDASSPEATERTIVTSTRIEASAQTVWDTVVAFPRIAQKPEGIFRFGIAYPIEARIDGSGVGAVRYCTFSTGSFVEPVTVWKPGELLAFDVTSSPVPMEEFSLYEHIDPPHLHGHMESHRGQFRIVPAESGVVLEGTTWYHHDMWPQWYWGPLTDQIIHKIHERVLSHIKSTAEHEGKR